MRKMLVGLTLALLPSALVAQSSPVTVTSSIQAVKEVTDAKGVKTRTLVAPTTVIPATPIVVWINYKNAGATPVSNFVINNPVPNGVHFTGLGENSGWGVVSVDGGKSFGALATLKVTNADKSVRAAIPQDVTHVRWTFAKPIAANGSGTLSFYAVVK